MKTEKCADCEEFIETLRQMDKSIKVLNTISRDNFLIQSKLFKIQKAMKDIWIEVETKNKLFECDYII